MKKLSKGQRIALMLVLVPLGIFVFGWITMQLWNNVLAQVINVSTITFWQAWGLIILSKLLFGGFGRGGYKRSPYIKKRMQERWSKMKDAQVNPTPPLAD
jgi:hypothetical protein